MNTPTLGASQNVPVYDDDTVDMFGPASNHGVYYVDEENVAADEGVDVEPSDDEDSVVFVAEERIPTPVVPDTPTADPAICIEMAAMAAVADLYNNPTIVIDEEEVEAIPFSRKRKNENCKGSASPRKRCIVKPNARLDYSIVAFGSPADIAGPVDGVEQLCKWTGVHTNDILIQRILENPIACYAKVNQHLPYLAKADYLIDIRNLEHRSENVEDEFRIRGLNVNTLNGAAKYARLDIILFKQRASDININYIVDGRFKYLSKLPGANANICYFFSEAIIGADGKMLDDKNDFILAFKGHKADIITLYFHDKRYDEALRLPSFMDHRPQLNRIRCTMLEGLIVSFHNLVFDIIDNDFGLDEDLQLIRPECGEDVNFNFDATLLWFEQQAMRLVRLVCVLFGISLKCSFTAKAALDYVIEALAYVDIDVIKRRLLQRHKWPLVFAVPKEHLMYELASENTRVFDGQIVFNY